MKRLYRVNITYEGERYEYVFAESVEEAERLAEDEGWRHHADDFTEAIFTAREITSEEEIEDWEFEEVPLHNDTEEISIKEYYNKKIKLLRTPGTREYQEAYEKIGQQKLFEGESDGET